MTRMFVAVMGLGVVLAQPLGWLYGYAVAAVSVTLFALGAEYLLERYVAIAVAMTEVAATAEPVDDGAGHPADRNPV